MIVLCSLRYADKKVEKSLKKVPLKDFERIGQEILKLKENPRPLKQKKVRGMKGKIFSLKVWPYRIFYEVRDKEKEIVILEVIHRKDLGKYL